MVKRLPDYTSQLQALVDAIKALPNYTNQLNALVSAASKKQSLPEWAVGMIGIVLGAGLALLSSLLVQRRRDVIIKRRIEEAIYREVLNGYWEALLMRQRLMSSSATPEIIQEEATARIGFEAYQNAKAKPDVFYDLTFVAEIEEVYRFLKKITEPSTNTLTLVQRINIAIRVLEEKIAAKRFDVKVLKAACPSFVKDRVDDLLAGKREPGSEP